MSQVMVSSGGVTSGCGGRRWSRFERARTRDCPTGNSIPYCVVSIWNLPLTRGALRSQKISVISRRMRSSYLSVVVGLFVHM